MTDKPNIQKLTDRINSSPNPKATFAILCMVLAAFKGKLDTATPEAISAFLESLEKGGQTA